MAAKSLDWEVSSALIQPGGGRRLRESVAQQLAVLILSGKLPEGHAFPGEVEYATQIGISRSALREAFRILAAKGLVEGRPKAGTRVTPRRQWSLLDPDLLAWQFKAEPSLKSCATCLSCGCSSNRQRPRWRRLDSPRIRCGRCARRWSGWPSWAWPPRRAVTPTSSFT